ncbi:anhydro-N-acetylmuramic acid kinase [Urechidicola vernalis]|uniref:Anhydro-N-acetylmuramic acid kinase n=1 Tax=Urechidicola vernalis TaxID=3075600 RepID=A0ABU2Y4R4_9FLAO|nr:anhydro-N-acetylmuramic acid kinase [Urechidicola sp. P050]MDT0552644.1 anhydro-N-acetylmuramic acid kinase [Urechidicola sp. P050]
MNDDKWFAIGLMSGTSLDGVDLVYASFVKGSYSYEIITSEMIPYSKSWEDKLRSGFDKDAAHLKLLDVAYGEYLGELINLFVKSHRIARVDFVASHGHTIFHKPEEGVTLQIGDGETISKLTGFKTVYDFRTQDVKLGGQGAPLVPIGDQLLFSDFEYCLNLGGFANISFDKRGERLAFDICPVNIVMNHYTQKIGLDYDDGGKIASEGTIHQELLDELDGLEFYNGDAPKSLGYEFVVEFIFPLIDNYNLEVKDVLRTFIAHIVNQIADKVSSPGQVFVTGGGAFNNFLIHQLQLKLFNSVIVPKNILINFKEALVFAFLGVLRIENKNNCLKSVTGANKDHCSGKIVEPK